MAYRTMAISDGDTTLKQGHARVRNIADNENVCNRPSGRGRPNLILLPQTNRQRLLNHFCGSILFGGYFTSAPATAQLDLMLPLCGGGASSAQQIAVPTVATE